MKAEEQEYDGRHIEVRRRNGDGDLLIDGKPFRYRQLPNGQYFLDEYAYGWSDDLWDLARKFVDYQGRSESSRRQGDSR